MKPDAYALELICTDLGYRNELVQKFRVRRLSEEQEIQFFCLYSSLVHQFLEEPACGEVCDGGV